jgi:aryl-alcohol dehydrogenase-like predicted oxidoreductase
MALGLGTMTILKRGQEEATEILRTALDEGIVHFDTADVYANGAVESLIGQTFSPEDRSRLFLASKGGNRMNATGTGWTWDPSYDYLKQACFESLNRLETSYLDLYYVHGGTMDDDLDASIRAMKDLQQEGRIKEYGLSSLRPNVIDYWLENSDFSYLMTPYSLLDRRIEELLPRLQERNIKLVARGPLAKGLLTTESTSRLQSVDRFEQYDKEQLEQVLTTLQAYPLPAMALQAIDQQADIVLPGASSVSQLQANLKAMRETLSAEEIAHVLSLLPVHTYTEHR